MQKWNGVGLLMDYNRFLNFEEMLTPKVISIIYLLGVIIIVLGALGTMIGSAAIGSYNGGLGMLGVIYGLLFLVCGNVAWRMICELTIVMFKINEHVSSVDKNLIAMKQNP